LQKKIRGETGKRGQGQEKNGKETLNLRVIWGFPSNQKGPGKIYLQRLFEGLDQAKNMDTMKTEEECGDCVLGWDIKTRLEKGGKKNKTSRNQASWGTSGRVQG